MGLGLAGSSKLQAPRGATAEDDARNEGYDDLAQILRGQAEFSALQTPQMTEILKNHPPPEIQIQSPESPFAELSFCEFEQS